MRKLLCLLVLFHLLVVAVAQNNTGLTLKMVDKPISLVLNEITKKAGYSFIIPTDKLDMKKKISINVKNQPIQNVLDVVFKGMDVTYRIEGKNVYVAKSVKKKSALSERNVQVSGIVVDENGEPFIGAVVVDKLTNAGTVTDMNGNFTISVPEGNVLNVSYIGYTTTVLKASDKKNLMVKLYEDTKKLDEVVVVGYGVQKKSDLTGAITSVKADDLNSTPTTTMAEMLRGKATGIQVNMVSSKPGGSSNIFIRGRRSLSGGNSPLYVVDGVPMESIDDINSNDISSLEVLKDASAQSVYGARAANGVILITTKRGVEGKPKVDYNFYIGKQNIHRNFDFYNGEEWADFRREAWKNANNGECVEESCFSETMRDVMNSGEWVDWEKLMIKPALQQKHDVTVRSGNDKTKLAFSLGYYSQDGMVINSGYDRITGRLNIDHKILKTLNLGANLYYAHAKTENADGSFNRFITMPPLAKVYNEDGSLRMDVTDAGESHYNPLWNMSRSVNDEVSDNYLTNLYLDWEIVKGLTYRANGSMSYRNNQKDSYLYRDHTTGKDTNGKATIKNVLRTEYLFENILNYNKEFNKIHRLGITLMQSVNAIKTTTNEQSAMGFSNDEKTYNAFSSAMEYGIPVHGISERKLLSYLGRVNYTLMDRYIFSASLRVDGSSVFGKDNKYGYFPSLAASWRLNEESFMKKIDWISNLKLRTSWGQVGNQAVDPYSTLGVTERYINEFGGENNVQIGFLPGDKLWNPKLKWETTTSTNIGLDFGFFKERISGTLEVYKTKTTDLLVTRKISQNLGYATQLENMGEVENKGVELLLTGYPIRNNKVTWALNYSISANRNKILKITGETDEEGKPKDDINSKWFIGKPMNVYYDYQFDGIWQTGDDIANSTMPNAQPGMIRVADVDGNGSIDDDDRIVIERDPKWISSFGTSLNIYGVDLALDFYVSHGGVVYNSYLTNWEQGGDLSGKRNGIKRDYWTPENPSNTTPAPNYTQVPAYITSLGYQDASYIRLRNLTIGYTLPLEISRKLFVQKLRVYFTANNLWTKTKVQSYSPETNTGAYPEPRTLLFGLNLSF